MALTDQQLVALARRHQDRLLVIRDRTRNALDAMWVRLVDGPDDAALQRWINAASPLLTAGMQAAAAQSVAWVPTYTTAASGAPAAIAGLDATDFLRPRGLDVAEVLAKPFTTFRFDLGRGVPFLDARQHGRQRAAQIGATDPMLAARSASTEAMKAEPRIVGYRRVPDGGACQFCLLASTQRYRDSDLMPIHPGCGCGIAPIVGDRDPGRVIDRGLVDRLMAADPTLGKRGDALAAAKAKLADADDQIAVHAHGELGPTLYPAGVRFDPAA